MLDSAMILEAAKDRFADTSFEWRQPAVGEPCLLVPAVHIAAVCRWLCNHAFHPLPYLACLSAVDEGDHFALVYHLTVLDGADRLALRVRVPRDNPHVPSVSAVYPTANWHEREAYDLMGIEFDGHPDLSRILLPDDWPGHPLRKDYQNPPQYHGMDTTRPDSLEMLARRTPALRVAE